MHVVCKDLNLARGNRYGVKRQGELDSMINDARITHTW